MKQYIIAIALIATTFFAAAKETEGKEKNIPQTVATAFASTFAHAENVKWEQDENFLIATFTMDEKNYSAYYYADGTLAVIARSISWKQLPKGLKENLEVKAVSGHVLAIYKMESDEGIRYYCEMQTAAGKEILQAFGSQWRVVNK